MKRSGSERILSWYLTTFQGTFQYTFAKILSTIPQDIFTTPNSLNELTNGTPIRIKHYVFYYILIPEHCDGLLKRPPKHVARFGQKKVLSENKIATDGESVCLYRTSQREVSP
jgi:hypothetical protein